MRALGLLGEQKREPCVYCRAEITVIEIRWKTSDGSSGTGWKPVHDCPKLKTTLSPLIEFDGEEDIFSV